jgi:hypothetical protein
VLLNAVDVKNSRGSVLSLPLDDISAGFVVKEIKGLDPVKATLVSSSFANMDGEQYHSSRREGRDIVLSLGLEPDWATVDVKTLRDQLYDFFMPKTPATLTFKMFDKFTQSVLAQTLDLNIDGRIESFEAPLFTQEPGVDISIRCFDPDFVDPNPVEVDGMSTSGLTEGIFTYDGTVDTGIVFTFKPDRAMAEFTIYHRPPDQTLRTTDVSYPFLAGDVVEISSVQGSKYATLTRAGVKSSILYAVSPQANWIELQPGDNNFRVYATGAAVPWSMVYTNKYGGL